MICSEIFIDAAIPAKVFLLTTLDFTFVKYPSSSSGNLWYKKSATTASKIVSPRNSKRSLEIKFSEVLAIDLWVSEVLKTCRLFGLYPNFLIRKRISLRSSLLFGLERNVNHRFKTFYLNFLNIAEVLCPPNPKVLDKATFTVRF